MDARLQMQHVFEAFNGADLNHEQIIDRIREIVGAKSTEPKIIQIEAVYDYGENGRYQPHVKVFALYDDGTVKQSSPAFIGEGWQPYAASDTPDIPQDEPAVDPIAEIEERGAVLRIDWDTSRIVWAMDSDGMREPIATHMSDGSARLVHLRAAAARLLARVRGSR